MRGGNRSKRNNETKSQVQSVRATRKSRRELDLSPQSIPSVRTDNIDDGKETLSLNRNQDGSSTSGWETSQQTANKLLPTKDDDFSLRKVSNFNSDSAELMPSATTSRANQAFVSHGNEGENNSNSRENKQPVHDVCKLPKKRKFDLSELEDMQEGPQPVLDNDDIPTSVLVTGVRPSDGWNECIMSGITVVSSGENKPQDLRVSLPPSRVVMQSEERSSESPKPVDMTSNSAQNVVSRPQDLAVHSCPVSLVKNNSQLHVTAISNPDLIGRANAAVATITPSTSHTVSIAPHIIHQPNTTLITVPIVQHGVTSSHQKVQPYQSQQQKISTQHKVQLQPQTAHQQIVHSHLQTQPQSQIHHHHQQHQIQQKTVHSEQLTVTHQPVVHHTPKHGHHQVSHQQPQPVSVQQPVSHIVSQHQTHQPQIQNKAHNSQHRQVQQQQQIHIPVQNIHHQQVQPSQTVQQRGHHENVDRHARSQSPRQINHSNRQNELSTSSHHHHIHQAPVTVVQNVDGLSISQVSGTPGIHLRLAVPRSEQNSAHFHATKSEYASSKSHQSFKSVVDASAQATQIVSGENVIENEVPRTTEVWSSQQGMTRTPVDLGEWKGHRVLAKRGSCYFPAIIKSVKNGCDLVVRMDNEATISELTYCNVFTSGKFEVVGDAAPSIRSLVEGARVVVRLDEERHAFVEGVVYERRLTQTPRYLVRIGGDLSRGGAGGDRWLSRPHVRLLRPPWWEDLEPCDSSSLQISGGQHVSGEGTYLTPCVRDVSSNLVGGSYPLTSTTYGDVTPPNHVTPPGSVAMTPISGQSGSTGSEELRRRGTLDDYDSDDDLRREDISFPSDTGKIIVFSLLIFFINNHIVNNFYFDFIVF